MSTAAFAPQYYDNYIVGYVRVVVHNTGPVKPGADISYNHWTVSLLVARDSETLRTQGPTESVRLDMRPEGPYNGELTIRHLTYLSSITATAYFDYPVTNTQVVTVAMVKSLIASRRRHRYSFTENGGCQYWCLVIIMDLEQAGYIVPGSATHLETVYRNNYSVTLHPFPHNIQYGTFY